MSDYYSRPEDVQTIWQNKKPSDIGTTRAGSFFGFHISREEIVAETNAQNGDKVLVHLAIGSTDIFDADTNSLTKTTIYSIVPQTVQFAEVLTNGGPRKVAEVVLQEGRSTQFRRLVDAIYENFALNVQDYVLKRLSELKVDSYDIDIHPLFNKDGVMKLGVTDMVWAQNVEADIVLGSDSFRNIGMYVGCIWIRISCVGSKAFVKAGIKWNLSLRPKRQAMRYRRAIEIPAEENENGVAESKEEEKVEEPAKKKQRRKRRKEEEEGEK